MLKVKIMNVIEKNPTKAIRCWTCMHIIKKKIDTYECLIT
jgi:hypothetical protein